MSAFTDQALIARVIIFKDNRAFDQLVCKYQSDIRRFFLNQTLGDKDLSDDLAQETFIKAYTKIATFKNLSDFSTWLIRIAYNVFYDYVRSKKQTEELDISEVDKTHYSEMNNFGRQMDVYSALQTLKDDECTCITLFYMEDFSIEKIAAITQFPAGTVKSHLSRGKEKMANWLKTNGYER